MTSLGEIQFRVGGYSGGAGLLIGNLNQLAEKVQPFSAYHCASCGRIDFYEAGL